MSIHTAITTQSLEQEMRDLSVAFHICEARRQLGRGDDDILTDLESDFNARARRLKAHLARAGISILAVREAAA